MQDLDLRCKQCSGYLNIKGVHSMIAVVRCPKQKCKALNTIKVVSSTSSQDDLKYKVVKDES